MSLIAVLVVGLAVGAGAGVVVAVILSGRQQAAGQELVAELRQQASAEREAAVQAAIASMVAVNRESLEGVQRAGVAELDSRKGLIDQRLEAMAGELGKVTSLVSELEKARERSYGQLTNQLTTTAETTAALAATTQSLREALASPKARGQWGERMAEDVLRLAGFVEGVNYVKQKAIATGTVPDFTFLLPRELRLHMDAKFPVASYLRYLECGTDPERDQHCAQFLRDVRARVKELTTRGYVDPEGGTVDYVLLFIPNESVYSFIHEHDDELLELALRQKVVFCSPLTLFAVLAVIRQAVDAFALERTSNEILSLFGAFADQYGRFSDQLDKLGRGLTSVEKAYEELAGTRRRQLERPLDRIEDLRRQRHLPVAGGFGAAADTDGLRVVGELRRAAEA